MMNPMVLSVEAADDLHRCSDVVMDFTTALGFNFRFRALAVAGCRHKRGGFLCRMMELQFLSAY